MALKPAGVKKLKNNQIFIPKNEKIDLTYEEMDLVIQALDRIKVDVEKIKNKASEQAMLETANSAQKYQNKIEDLKTKFLHSN